MTNQHYSSSDYLCVQYFLQNGDKEAFDELYNRYLTPTYRFVYSRVGSKEWTEDIVSETFITLLQSLPRYRPEASFKSFVFSIAMNKMRQFWQEKIRKPVTQLPEDIIFHEPEPLDEEKEERLAQLLEAILAQLSEQQRRVLTERFFHEHTVNETADILGLSPENVRVIQHRALKKAAEIGETLL